ncbi:MAG: glycosyltransferase family 2 protein [Acidobacteriota bacterium]
MLDSRGAVDLDVVVVNWNSGPLLERLLDSLEALRAQIASCVVVDNASSDGSEGAALREGVELLRFPENRGFAAAANAGVARGAATFFLLVNPDVEVRAPSVRGLCRELERRPEAGLACGRLVDAQGRSQFAFQVRSLPTLGRAVAENLFLDHLWPRRTPAEPAVPIEVEQPAAAAWLVRRAAWEALGGLDEGFFPAWFEDVDFCRRLRRAGWRMWYFPQYEFRHSGGYSVERLGRERFHRHFRRNELRYWRKHHPAAASLLWLPNRLGLLLRCAGAWWVGRRS